MTREEIKARIEELSLEFHGCSSCDTPRKCKGMEMCMLGEVGEEEEDLRQQLAQMDKSNG